MFSYKVNKNGTVRIYRDNNPVTILRNRKAEEFIKFVEENQDDENQMYMAKITGNYKRGNERQARQHPRNR